MCPSGCLPGAFRRSQVGHPLSALSEDEEMLRDSAERFAKEILAPHVQAMAVADACHVDCYMHISRTHMHMYIYILYIYICICLITINQYMYGIEYTSMGDMLEIMWSFCGEAKAAIFCSSFVSTENTCNS